MPARKARQPVRTPSSPRRAANSLQLRKPLATSRVQSSRAARGLIESNDRRRNRWTARISRAESRRNQVAESRIGRDLSRPSRPPVEPPSVGQIGVGGRRFLSPVGLAFCWPTGRPRGQLGAGYATSTARPAFRTTGVCLAVCLFAGRQANEGGSLGDGPRPATCFRAKVAADSHLHFNCSPSPRSRARQRPSPRPTGGFQLEPARTGGAEFRVAYLFT